VGIWPKLKRIISRLFLLKADQTDIQTLTMTIIAQAPTSDGMKPIAFRLCKSLFKYINREAFADLLWQKVQMALNHKHVRFGFMIDLMIYLALTTYDPNRKQPCSQRVYCIHRLLNKMKYTA
jgi:hypothetical protein